MMKYFIFFTLILCFSLPGAYAQEITVPIDHYPPWKIVVNGKATGGVDIELIDALLDGFNFDTVYEAHPWQRCLLMMEQGKGDLISGITMTEERKKYLSYLMPPYKTESVKVLYVLKGRENDFQTLNDLEGKSIGLLRGASFFKDFDTNDRIIKTHLDSDLQGLSMVISARIDGYIMTMENAQYILTQDNEMTNSLTTAIWKHTEEVNVYFAISKKSDLINHKYMLEQKVKKMVETGTTERIIYDYFH